MPGITTAFAQGLAANRPAAASSNAGYFWLSTDVNGGTLYQSTGSAWTQVAASVNAGSSGGGGSFTGEVSASDFKATGLTGATSASRYVGATTSGHPTSGTFAVGDVCVDQTGAFWICSVAGTPGTWVEVASSGGSVTSVAMTVPAGLSVSGSPITTSGTLAVTWSTESANTVLAGPSSGSAAAPTFRALVTADVPEPVQGASLLYLAATCI